MARCSGNASLVLAGAALLVLAAASGAAVQGEAGELAFASTIDVSTESEADVASQMIEAFVSISKQIKTGRKLQESVVSAAAPANVTGVDAASIQAKVGAAPAAPAAAPAAILVCVTLPPMQYFVTSTPLPVRRRQCDLPPLSVLPPAWALPPALLPAWPCCWQVLASAIATWQLGMINGPTNKGLKPTKFKSYNLNHYYQVGGIAGVGDVAPASWHALWQPGCTCLYYGAL